MHWGQMSCRQEVKSKERKIIFLLVSIQKQVWWMESTYNTSIHNQLPWYLYHSIHRPGHLFGHQTWLPSCPCPRRGPHPAGWMSDLSCTFLASDWADRIQQSPFSVYWFLTNHQLQNLVLVSNCLLALSGVRRSVLLPNGASAAYCCFL